MSRRTGAALLAAGLIVVLWVIAARVQTNYVTFRPGPTVDVLGKTGTKQIIDVTGRKVYRDNGDLRLVTIIPSQPDDKVSLIAALSAWASPDDAVYPYDAVYQPQDTAEAVKQQSQQQMTSSQDNAVAAALSQLKIKFGSAVTVAVVDKDGPSNGKLKINDRLLKVDGKAVTETEDLIALIREKPIGSTLDVEIRRTNVVRHLDVKTVASADGKKKSAIRVQIAPGYDFPFHVGLQLADNIGGPSAGLMFSMGVYDVLTPGSLTGGRIIAGTGEITAQGKVGEIGGIQQKLVGAQDDGAQLFMVPAGNCAEALGGHYDPKKMRLVRVATLAEGIAAVKAWTANPTAELPRCTK